MEVLVGSTNMEAECNRFPSVRLISSFYVQKWLTPVVLFLSLRSVSDRLYFATCDAGSDDSHEGVVDTANVGLLALAC